jgi:Uma2 family endonuclease
MADLWERLGRIPLDRIWANPAPGTATEKDVIDVDVHKNGLCELVDGTLVERAYGFEEALVGGQLVYRVISHVKEHNLGICVGAGGTMRFAPGLVRMADLAFIPWDKLPGGKSPREPIPDLVPDLAAEIFRPRNTEREMARKVREYFGAGVRLVWLIKPTKRIARVFTAVGESTIVMADQMLDGGVVLPGFQVRLSDVLDYGQRPRSRD